MLYDDGTWILDDGTDLQGDDGAYPRRASHEERLAALVTKWTHEAVERLDGDAAERVNAKLVHVNALIARLTEDVCGGRGSASRWQSLRNLNRAVHTLMETERAASWQHVRDLLKACQKPQNVRAASRTVSNKGERNGITGEDLRRRDGIGSVL